MLSLFPQQKPSNLFQDFQPIYHKVFKIEVLFTSTIKLVLLTAIGQQKTSTKVQANSECGVNKSLL